MISESVRDLLFLCSPVLRNGDKMSSVNKQIAANFEF